MKTQQDYFLASKEVSFFPLMMTLIATQVGGGLVLGSSQEAYQYGWSVLLYPLGQSLGFILLALGIGKKMAESGASTIAELCERAFGSVNLRKIASLLSIVSLFMIFVAQVIASRKFMISLGFSDTWIFLAFWGLVIVYTVMGGLKAVIATDVVQAAFFIVVFFLALFLAEPLGVNVFLVDTAAKIESSFDSSTSYQMIGWLIMPLLFMGIEQDMGQRFFAAKSPKIVTGAAFGAAVVTFSVCCIPVMFGVFAKQSDLSIPEGGSVLMTVIQATTNPAVTALVACAILAAIISTADSLINAISSNITQDFRLGEKSVLFSRGITALISISGLVFSFYFTNIVGILIQSYDLSVSCLFVPVMIALLRGKGSYQAAWGSILTGALAFSLLRIQPLELPKELISIFCSASAYFFIQQAVARKDARLKEELS